MDPHFLSASMAFPGDASPERNLRTSVSHDDLHRSRRTAVEQLARSPASSSYATSESGLAPRKPRGKGKGTSHSRKKDEHHIPRPRNAFILFRCHVVANNLVPEELERDHRNISRIISHMWNSLSESDRGVWAAEAQKEKEAHAKLYPDYKYQPVYRKPVSAKRNVVRTEGVEQQCERAADLIMKMCGDGGIARDGDKGPISQSQKKKEQGRLRAQAKAAARLAQSSRPKPTRTESYSTTSDTSQSHDDGDDMDSEAEGRHCSKVFTRAPVFTSVAGDLASSVEPNYFGQPLQYQQQLSGADLHDFNLGNAAAYHTVHAQQVSQQGARVSLWESLAAGTGPGMGNANDSSSSNSTESWDGNARSGFLNDQYVAHGIQIGGLAPRQAVTSTRKAPPPPLFHSNSTPLLHAAYTDASTSRNDSRNDFWGAGLAPTLSSFGGRPKSMEMPTPRAVAFAASSSLGAAGQLANDVTLISPLRGGFRRTSAHWQHWNAAAGNNPTDAQNYSYRHHVKRPSYAGVATPMQARPPPLGEVYNRPVADVDNTSADDEHLFDQAADEVAASFATDGADVRVQDVDGHSFDIGQANCGYGITIGSNDGVFHFTPDFLTSAQHDLGNVSSPGSSLQVPSYDGTSVGDTQELLSTPSPMSSNGQHRVPGLHHRHSFQDRPSSSGSTGSLSSLSSSGNTRFVPVTSPTTARASSFAHDEIARQVGQRILGRWSRASGPPELQGMQSTLDAADNINGQYNEDYDAIETLIDADTSAASNDSVPSRYPRSVPFGSAPSALSLPDQQHENLSPRRYASTSSAPMPQTTWDMYEGDTVGQAVSISALDGAFVAMLQQQRLLASSNDGGVSPSQSLHSYNGESHTGHVQLQNGAGGSDNAGELFSPSLLRSAFANKQYSTTPDYSPSVVGGSMFQQQQQTQLQYQQAQQQQQQQQQQTMSPAHLQNYAGMQSNSPAQALYSSFPPIYQH